MVLARNMRTCLLVGWLPKTATPMTRLEKWSTTQATHQQKGQRCGRAKGSHVTQNPPIGTVVRSTCQTWLGYLAVTMRLRDSVAA